MANVIHFSMLVQIPNVVYQASPFCYCWQVSDTWTPNDVHHSHAAMVWYMYVLSRPSLTCTNIPHPTTPHPFISHPLTPHMHVLLTELHLNSDTWKLNHVARTPFNGAVTVTHTHTHTKDCEHLLIATKYAKSEIRHVPVYFSVLTISFFF